MIFDGDKTATGATLDELFRRAGVRTPHALALSDPPNRESFTDGAPRSLTYAATDRAISTLAARLHGLGLKADAVVAFQLPNTVESVITLLGVLRAGMIGAPLPLLWRQQEVVAALRGIGAKAIITCGRAGTEQPTKTAMLAAAELFSIRHVCAFGSDLPGGVVPLNEVFAPSGKFVPEPVRPGAAGTHVAAVTFDVTAAGIVPVARNAAQFTAGGLAVFLEAGLVQGVNILSTIPPASFSGIALTVMPWLLAGGSLALHHSYDPKALVAQSETLSDPTLILPGPALVPLAETGRLLAFKHIIALWRAPERLATTQLWDHEVALTDVSAFGEVGLLAGKRGANHRPLPIPCGLIHAPRGVAGAVTVAQCTRTQNGTLALRGAMAPTQLFPPGRHAKPIEFVDTGFKCAIDDDGFVITGPPAGISAVGGYRFTQQAMDAMIAETDPAATIMAVPNGLLGQRLAGCSTNPQMLIAALQARGINPLVAGAFGRLGRSSTT